MLLNLEYDANALAASQSFRDGLQAAANILDALIVDPITVNISVGYGEITANGTATTLTNGQAEAEPLTGSFFSYSAIRADLANGVDSAVAAGVAALPVAGSIQGQAKVLVWSAEEKALGLMAAAAPGLDGAIGFSAGIAASELVGVAIHEIAHVLGRIPYPGQQPDIFDLYRFSSPGVRLFANGTISPPSAAAYFSLDNGATDLGDYATADPGDYDNGSGRTPNDPFNAFYSSTTLQQLTPLDILQLEALGYNTGVPGPMVGPGMGGTPQVAPAAGGALTGGAGDDWLEGQGGNDILHGGPGSDYLDGGAGLNTATYDGVYRQYTVVAGGTGVTGGPEGGRDVLVNIERIQFVDGYLATSPTDTAGQVYRLYEATLGHAPDPEGLANWVHALNNGASLQSVAQGFIDSAEFQAIYGPSLSDTAFVTLLYENVLHRAPDTAGLANWVNLLTTGESRAQVVTGFSESTENINTLAAPVQAGLWIQDVAAAEVARLYDATLGRLPDVLGLANWTHMLESGAETLLQVTQGFVSSAEFQAEYGALNDSQFVQLLYENTLHRAADTAGLNSWVSQLASGETRAQVVMGFSESAEHIANTAAHVDYGVWVTS